MTCRPYRDKDGVLRYHTIIRTNGATRRRDTIRVLATLVRKTSRDNPNKFITDWRSND